LISRGKLKRPTNLPSFVFLTAKVDPSSLRQGISDSQLAKQDSKSFSPDKIYFAEIGRKSHAHLKAYQAYQRKKADIQIEAEDILGLVLRLK